MRPASSVLPRRTTGRWRSVPHAVAYARPRQRLQLASPTTTLSPTQWPPAPRLLRRRRPGGSYRRHEGHLRCGQRVCRVAQTAADGGRGGGGDGGGAQALSPLPPPHLAHPQHGPRRPRRHPRLLAGCRSAALDHSRARHCRVRVCTEGSQLFQVPSETHPPG